MARLQTLKPRVASVASRLRPVQVDRQAVRQYATNSSQWLAIRQQVLMRDSYTCQTCGRVCGRKGEAHVDHIDGDSGNNPEDGSNWQTLCAPCHSRKTAKEDGGFGNRSKA